VSGLSPEMMLSVGIGFVSRRPAYGILNSRQMATSGEIRGYRWGETDGHSHMESRWAARGPITAAFTQSEAIRLHLFPLGVHR